MPACAFVLRADWREKTDSSNRGRGACSKRHTSDRGFGEVVAGSAETASKVKGGSPLALKRKKWKKGGCFLLRLRGCRERESQGLLRHPGIAIRAQGLTETQRWLTTRGGRAVEGLHLHRGDLTSGVEQGQTKSIPAGDSQQPSSQESAERSHHGCPTHAGISRLFAHGESRRDIVFPEMSPFCLCFFFSLWLSPCHSPHRAGVDPSSH